MYLKKTSFSLTHLCHLPVIGYPHYFKHFTINKLVNKKKVIRIYEVDAEAEDER